MFTFLHEIITLFHKRLTIVYSEILLITTFTSFHDNKSKLLHCTSLCTSKCTGIGPTELLIKKFKISALLMLT